jgi:hypothetical protein
MIYELERIRKEVVVEWSSYPEIFLERLRKTMKKLMAGVPVAIRAEHLQNTILERYRCTSQLNISSCRTTNYLPWKIVPPEKRCTQSNPFVAHVNKTCFDTVWAFLLSDVPLYRTGKQSAIGFPFPGDFHSPACRQLKWTRRSDLHLYKTDKYCCGGISYTVYLYQDIGFHGVTRFVHPDTGIHLRWLWNNFCRFCFWWSATKHFVHVFPNVCSGVLHWFSNAMLFVLKAYLYKINHFHLVSVLTRSQIFLKGPDERPIRTHAIRFCSRYDGRAMWPHARLTAQTVSVSGPSALRNRRILSTTRKDMKYWICTFSSCCVRRSQFCTSST